MGTADILDQGSRLSQVYRTTLADSWRWMRLGLLVRLLPLTIGPLVFSWLTATPLAIVCLTLVHSTHDLVVALPLAVAVFVIVAVFAGYLARSLASWLVPAR